MSSGGTSSPDPSARPGGRRRTGPGDISGQALGLRSGQALSREGGRHRWLALGIVGSLVAFHVYGLTDTVALGAKPGVALWMLLALAAALWRMGLVLETDAVDRRDGTGGVTTQGVTTQGVTTQGVTTQGVTTQGVTTQSVTTQGVTTQGHPYRDTQREEV